MTGKDLIPEKGPVLIASTHPNSFLDAIIICLKLDRPVWSLARGDAFKNPLVKAFLTQIKILPIYRLSEGKENLGKNDETFDQVQVLLNKDQQVLIFSEGLCIHQTELLPLKKGTARLVQMAWEDGIPTPVSPVGLTYSNFTGFDKVVNLNFGGKISEADFPTHSGGIFLRQFNETLKGRLQNLLSWEFKKASFFQNPLYYIGWAVNFPWYFFCQFLSKKMTKGTVHFDSVLFGLLTFTLPIYWAILYNVIQTLR